MSNVSEANQHTNDEREQKMWDIYVTKLAKGIDNAKASAIEAGYSESHADNITLQGWFKGRKEKLKRKDIFSKAEKVIDKTLSYDTDETDDETGKTKVNTSLLGIQSNVALTVAKSLGKEFYSDRLEVTGKDGKDIASIKVEIIQPNATEPQSNTDISQD
jgi:hypothetical protein